MVSLHIPEGDRFLPPVHDRPFRLRWDRADLSQYETVVASLLSGLCLPTDALLCSGECCFKHAGVLEKYYTSVVNCLQQASVVCIPRVRAGVEKHWWSLVT